MDNWATPTAFGAMLPTLSSSVTTGTLALAPLLALTFVVLVALPLRLLAGAIRGRIRMPSLQSTGRNRSRATISPAATPSTRLNPWLAGAVPLAGAAGLILIAGGVEDQVRYLRLAIAVVIGIGFTRTVEARARSIVSMVEIGSVIALAAIAWLLHGLLGSADGFWSLLAVEHRA